MDLAEAIAVFITGILSLGMIDGFMSIAPGFELVINGVFIGKDKRTGLDGLTDRRLNGRLLDVGKHLNHNCPATLDHAQDRRLLFLQRPSPRRSF
jgi:hypothetical protein